MRVTITEESDRVVARWVADALADAIARRGRAVFVASAGRTPSATYRRLAAAHRGDVDFSRVVLVQMDEYVGRRPDDPRSPAHYLTHHVVRPLGVREVWWWNAPDGSAARSTASQCSAATGADVILHGIGRNGHVGFNEPPCVAAAPSGRVVLAADTCRDNGVEPETIGVTLGLDVLLRARRTVLLACGSVKARAVLGATRPPTPSSPASWLQMLERYDLVADPQAAALVRARDA